MTSNDPHGDVRTMSIYRKYLDLIASGAKTVEVRVAYPNNRKLAPGELLTFVSGDVSCTTRITKINEYKTFEDMLNVEDTQAIAGEPETREDLITACRKIYPPEKEALGVLAIHIEVVPW